MIQKASQRHREFILTDNDFHILRKLINHHTGISLSESKRELVYSRLTRRLRKLNLKDFSSYCRLLQDNVNTDEVVYFTNAVTTNLTSFFRESHHFDFFKSKLLPELVRNNVKNHRIRVWSAGCSTGEEPYSIAISAKETIPFHSNFKILASDVDSSVLEIASRGLYSYEKLKPILPHTLHKWFSRIGDTSNDLMQVRADLQKTITFKNLNLMHEWPMNGPFDAIFCRNVVIYFDKPTQKVLVDRFANLLADGGYLFLGHSESLFKVTDRFQLVGQTIYRKIR